MCHLPKPVPNNRIEPGMIRLQPSTKSVLPQPSQRVKRKLHARWRGYALQISSSYLHMMSQYA